MRRAAVAHDLPPRDRFVAELESLEVKTTAAGNTVLDARAADHHADLAVAAAIAFCLGGNAPRAFSEAPIAGYWGLSPDFQY